MDSLVALVLLDGLFRKPPMDESEGFCCDRARIIMWRRFIFGYLGAYYRPAKFPTALNGESRYANWCTEGDQAG
jgi:hypothetical protein